MCVKLPIEHYIDHSTTCDSRINLNYTVSYNTYYFTLHIYWALWLSSQKQHTSALLEEFCWSRSLTSLLRFQPGYPEACWWRLIKQNQACSSVGASSCAGLMLMFSTLPGVMMATYHRSLLLYISKFEHSGSLHKNKLRCFVKRVLLIKISRLIAEASAWSPWCKLIIEARNRTVYGYKW